MSLAQGTFSLVHGGETWPVAMFNVDPVYRQSHIGIFQEGFLISQKDTYPLRDPYVCWLVLPLHSRRIR